VRANLELNREPGPVGIALVLLLCAISIAGCDFFKELESLPEAGEDESGDGGDYGTGETGADGEPCDVLDEHCADQDTLRTCNFETGALETVDCVTACGQYSELNFTCTPTAEFLHGCWCVAPGNIKIDTCAQLESCVIDCGGDPDSSCVMACFGRTDAQTVRLLGTLYSCADRTCDELCAASPADCGTCLLAARAGLWGDCGVEREVCNADEIDGEPSWP
jgi:hypothetical protein